MKKSLLLILFDYQFVHSLAQVTFQDASSFIILVAFSEPQNRCDSDHL